jgi:hypothetical protein
MCFDAYQGMEDGAHDADTVTIYPYKPIMKSTSLAQ